MLEATRLQEQTEPDEPLAAAVAGVRRRLFRNNDTDQVVADFIEDDLREGLRAFGEVDSFFADLLAALAGNGSRADLLAAADDASLQEQLEYLVGIAGSLRRRIALLAARPDWEGTQSPEQGEDDA
jgi:hypothetical protein